MSLVGQRVKRLQKNHTNTCGVNIYGKNLWRWVHLTPNSLCTMGKGEAMEGKSLEMISNKSLERSHVDLFGNIYFSPSHAYIFAHSQCASLIFYLWLFWQWFNRLIYWTWIVRSFLLWRKLICNNLFVGSIKGDNFS